MAFPDDLLEQAEHLARREKKKPRQASLRRAVSTCYYALFHFLINEATQNWKRADQRNTFARLFEHGKMRNASERQIGECNRLKKQTKAQSRTVDHLLTVTEAFVELQHQRHIADYDNSKKWTRTEVLGEIDSVHVAFESLKAIRHETLAQTYLLSLLGNPRG
jgi:uncharacterized protein (UPF0332 family)